MKKKLSLLILLVLALTAILAACGNSSSTQIIPRWEDGESYTYAVTLADFDNSADATTYFTQHEYNGATYYKDYVVRAGEPLSDLDEVRPVAVSGTYTLAISSYDLDGNKYDKVTTCQYLEVTYELAGGKIKLDTDLFAELPEALSGEPSDDVSNPVAKKDGASITLRSTAETSVEFKRNDDGKQAPKSSSSKVVGFYIGKSHQEVSSYEITTTYDYSGKRPVARIARTVDGNTEEIENTLKGYSEGKFIDSNQLFMYARSLDKSLSSLPDSPGVTVYNPFTQEMQTASFTYTADVNAALSDATHGEFYAKVPVVGVTVGGIPFMSLLSAPKFTDENGKINLDSADYGQFTYAKHSPLRFRVGYLSFELTQYDEAIYSALVATTATSEK